MKKYVFEIPDNWELKQCYVEIDCKESKYRVLNLVPNKIVEKHDGEYEKWNIDPDAIVPATQPEHNPDDERKIADLHKMVNYLLSQLEQRWIPCSEETGDGYPEEDGFYYVTEQNYGFYLDAAYKQRVTHTSHFKNGDFTDRFYTENNSNIIAWMPLPEPYREEGEYDDNARKADDD